MRRAMTSAAVLALGATTAEAGGIERASQSAMVLFETGNHFELSLGYVEGTLSGRNAAPFPAQDIDNVADPFFLPSAAVKFDINEQVAMALIFERPFGADIAYQSGNLPFGGTTAEASTSTVTALMKYKFTDNLSAFGGLRYEKAEGAIHLQGLAYGAVSGYDVTLDSTSGLGYVLGVAYEKPEIALRVALTYNSSITHDMRTTESGPLVDPDGPGPLPALPLLAGTSSTEVKLPESWNLEFQTGIAKDTLLFGSIRHVKHSQFRVDPAQFGLVTGSGLIDLEDTTTYKLGIGRRFSDKFAGSLALTYEPPGKKLVSPLAPRTGFTQISLGGSYNLTEALTLSGGVSYIWLGDAKPETGTPDTARASFSDNSAVAVGFKIAMKF